MEPLLSVCLITYNHVNFIEQAVEGVLMQRVNFPWELIVADDFSTDGTRDILLEYQKKYPNFIKLILQDKNVGPAKNWFDLISEPKAKYIAYFDGDDYWTDPYKLQKQVDFLEKNEEYTLCFHKINILNKEGLVVKDFITKVPENYETFENLAYRNFIHTPSVVFRSKYLPLPLELSYAPVGDYVLWLHLASHGKIHYIPESMAIYREGVGFWSSKSQSKRLIEWCFVLFICIDYFKRYNIETPLKKQLDSIYSQLSETFFHELVMEGNIFSNNIRLYKLFISLFKGAINKFYKIFK
jgi:glycosyltransferase involved in cell wall biosynthesis